METRATFTEKDAEGIAYKYYGIKATAKRQSGECDFNFVLTTDGGRKFVLKISHADEKIDQVKMQNEVLYWLDAQPRTFVHSTIIKTRDTRVFCNLLRHNNMVRLFNFVPGVMFIHENNLPDDVYQTLGTQLAELTLALRGFDHPAARRYQSWDLTQAEWIREKLSAFTDSAQRECVTTFLDNFSKHVKPVLANLPHSVIHGDVNTQNTLVSCDFLKKRYVSGFIDFGDMVYSATICELAIAITYAAMEHNDPMKAAHLILASYHKKAPLQEAEVDVLFDLICIRLCISVTHAAVNRQNDTTNPHFSSSEDDAWRLLNIFKLYRREDITREFKNLCGFAKIPSLTI